MGAGAQSTHLVWDDIDTISLHVNGTNGRALARTSFPAQGRSGIFTDGRPHALRIVYTGKDLTVYVDSDPRPTLVTPLDLRALGVVGLDDLAWVGFTAATGVTSIDADLLSFAYCYEPGC